MRQSGFGTRQYLIARLPRLTARNDIGKHELAGGLTSFRRSLIERSTVCASYFLYGSRLAFDCVGVRILTK